MGLIETLSSFASGTNSNLALYQPSEDNLVKARRVILDRYKPERGVQALEYDPMYLIRQMGYKDRPSQLSFDMMRHFAYRLGVINAIIQVRSNQVAAFAQPWRHTRTLGFQIRHKDRDHLTTLAEQEIIRRFEIMFMQCGRGDNPFEKGTRPDFEAMLKMSVRDTLTYDQDCLEIVPDKRGIPFSWHQVDASLIRICSDNVTFKQKDERSSVYGQKVPTYQPSFLNALEHTEYTPEDISYLQVIRDQVTAVFSEKDLLYSIRNPTSYVRNQGYGYSEIEMVISTLTSHLNAEEYNQNAFKHGALPEGILNIQDEHIDPEMLDSFKREWRAMLSGYENHFKLPILQSSGAQFIPTGTSQKEAEYMKWLEYLIKVTTAVFLIDPSEINFSFGSGFSMGASDMKFESSNEAQIKSSKDKGLRPLLRFQAKKMQKILDRIDDHFMFEFVGLDELTDQERREQASAELQSYKTLNEVRASQDLPPVEVGGDVPLNPTYIQWVQIQQQAEQQQAQQDHEKEMAQAEQQQQPAEPKEKEQKSKVGSKGGVPVGHTSGSNPRMKYANEKPQPNDHKKSLNAGRRTVELVIED